MFAGILGIHRAFAIGQAGDEGAGAFLAEDIAVRQAVLRKGALHHLGEAAAGRAEEAVAGIDDLLGGVLARIGRPRIDRQRCPDHGDERHEEIQTGEEAEWLEMHDLIRSLQCESGV